MATVNIYDSITMLDPFVVLATDNQDITTAPATINNVTLASGDRVFLIGQSTATQNGGYVFNGAGSAMTRTADLAVGAVIKSGTVFQVLLGRPHRQIFFQIHATADEVSDITIGTTAFTYRFVNDGKISYAGYVPAASGLQADATDLLSTHSVLLLGGDDYSAKVPLNSAFQYMIIDNSLRNYTLKLFPSSGGTLGAGVDTYITIYPYEIVHLYGIGDIGNGQEWVVYRPVSQSLTVGVKHKAPSEDAVYDAIRIQAASGTVIDFANPKVFGTVASPETGNITDNLTGAIAGVIQKIYHNNGTAPTFPAGWVKLSGTYGTGLLNIIYAEWVSGTRVEYWIARS